MKIKKLISFMVLTALFVMTIGPAVAVATPTVDTNLLRGEGGGSDPIIKVKWEMNGPCFDPSTGYNDCSTVTGGEGTDADTDPGAQFMAPGVWNSSMNYTVCAIATDPNGVSDVNGVYADIYYPEGRSYHPEDPLHLDQISGGTSSNWDYGVNACGAFIEQNTLIKLDKDDGIDLFCNKIKNNNNNLPTFFPVAQNPADPNNPGPLYDYDEICGVTGELEKEEAHVYCDDKTLTWEDPAGYYKVIVSAQDNAGNSSNYVENHFAYLPLTSFAADFTAVNYGEVLLNVHKKISGDLNFGTASNPTVRNLGNTRLYMKVAQDDMGLGQSSGNWNVQYDARLGSNSADWRIYSPFKYKATAGDPTSDQYQILEDILDLSEEEEMDFSILVTKWPTVATTFVGDMWLSASPAQFRQCYGDPVNPL